MTGSNCNSLESSFVDLSEKENQEEKERHHSGDSGIEATDNSEDLSIENGLVANIDPNHKSLIVNSDGTTFLNVSRIHTIINTLNNAVNENNYEELEKIIENIQNYENISVVDLGGEKFKNFCIDHLNLKLEDQRIKNIEARQSNTRDDHQHIYSNILSKYKFDTESYNNDYSVKELVLLAIVANDELAEKYRDILFDQENLSLLPLLVSGRKYISTFIEKFPDLYQSLKDQAVQFNEFSKIGFFSIVALRKEQGLLSSILVEYVLKDLETVLQTSKPDPLYGVFETASLTKNEEFIKMVLSSMERHVSDSTKKDLLKKSFVTFLEGMIGQEHEAFVEHLCKKCTEVKDPVVQEIYKEALADEKIISQLNKQIIKKIITGSTNGSRKGKGEEIYKSVLKTASLTGNIEFIKKVLDLIENDPQFSGDEDRQAFLQGSLIIILENSISAKHISVIECLCKKYAACSDYVVNHLGQKLKNNELDDIYESILLMFSNSSNRDLIINVLAHIQIYQSIKNDEQVIRQAIQNILRNAIEQADDMVIGLLHISIDLQTPAIQKIYIKECKKALPMVEEKLERTSQLLVKKPEVGWGIVNKIPFCGETREEVFSDITATEYFKITDIMSSLYRIRGLLQNNANIQAENVLETKEESHIVEDKLQKKSNDERRSKASEILPTIPEEEQEALELEEFEELENNIALSGQEPTEDNSNDFLTNNCEEGKMFNNINDIEAGLLGAIQTIDFKQVQRWVKEKGAIVNENVLNKANERLNVLKDSQSTKNKKNSKTQQIKNMGEITEFLQQVHGKLQSSVMLDVEDQSSDSGRGSASASGCTTPVSDDNQEAQQLVQQEQAMIEIDNSGSQKTTQQTSRNSFLQPLAENQLQQESSTETAASDTQVVLSRKAKRKVRQAAQKQSQLGANDNPSSDKGADDSSILRVLIDNYDKNTGKRTIKHSNGNEVTIQDVVDKEDSIVHNEDVTELKFGFGQQEETKPKTLATGDESNDSQSDTQMSFTNQANGFQGNEQHSDPVKNNTTSQRAEEEVDNWSRLAIAPLLSAAIGVGVGVLIMHFASASLLAIGIVAGIGACCLVAALVIYYCNKPSNSLEGSSITASANSVPVV